MDRFCIIANHEKDIGYETAKQIKKYLGKKGKDAEILEESVAVPIEDNFEAAIILGGDGTMIRAAKQLKETDIPMIGINLGTLGFLPEIEKSNLFTELDKVLNGDTIIQKRIALQGTAEISGSERDLGLAVNDFIIGKRGFGKIITMKVFVNGEMADEYFADGVIIATPTGSTAYNLSAGGPILTPEMQAIIVTPICPHSLNKRSIVVSSSDRICVKVGRTRENTEDLATVSADGTLLTKAATGDTINIVMAKHQVKIIMIEQDGFFHRMRDKLNRYEKE